jgi:hypothetical protein
VSPGPCPPPGSLVRGHMRETRTVWGLVISCSESGNCLVMLPGGSIVTMPAWDLRVVAPPGHG